MNKTRFGEIKIGETFTAFGKEMVKQDAFNALTTDKRGKQAFLFFRDDLVTTVKKVVVPVMAKQMPVIDDKERGNQETATPLLDNIRKVVCIRREEQKNSFDLWIATNNSEFVFYKMNKVRTQNLKQRYKCTFAKDATLDDSIPRTFFLQQYQNTTWSFFSVSLGANASQVFNLVEEESDENRMTFIPNL